MIEMKTFKQYQRFIKEELDSRQKKTVDGWIKEHPDAQQEGHPNAVAISNHVIPRGSHKVTIPFEDDDQAVAHPEVEKHLRSHGYSIDNYKKGTVRDKYNRQVSIGKVLQKTKAEDSVKNSFLNDPNRRGARQSSKGLSVTITRQPHQIAGMSTGQGWTSCVDMKCGFEKRYLKDEVREGTHVAYLHHVDDPDMKKPIARVALKPYRSEDGTSTILRAEDQVYGDSPDAFKRNVDAWAEKHFPVDKDKLYLKNKKVYDDGSEQIIGDADSIRNHPKKDIRRMFFYNSNKKVTPKHIDDGLNDEDWMVRHHAVLHANATRANVEKALKDEQPLVQYAANSKLRDMEKTRGK